MGSCNESFDCTDSIPTATISVLPDIVGIGILTSFSVTAGAAFGTLLYSYFTDSLPRGSLSWADWGFLQKYHSCKNCRIRYGAINKKDRPIKLVTGPAMIVAALVQHCQLSVYEFQVVNSLAFLSSTTHLATLVMLRQYLRENKVVRNIRVIAMVLNLGLLVYTTIVAYTAFSVDNSNPIQFVIDCLSSLQPDRLDFANTIVTIMFLFVSYGQTISQLYFYDEDTSFLKAWLRKYCYNQPQGPKLGQDEFEKWYEKGVMQSIHRPGSDARRKFIWSQVTTTNDGKERRYLQPLFTVRGVWFDFQESFLGGIPALLMGCSLAITQVAITRTNKPDIENSENTFDFGQIVPIFLLSLPVLAMVEMYFETHPDLAEEDPGSLKNIGPKLKRLRRNLFEKKPSELDKVSRSPHDSALEPHHIDCLSSSHEEDNKIMQPFTSPVDASFAMELLRQKLAPDPALDPMAVLQYTRQDVQIYLNLLFWANASFSVATGVVIGGVDFNAPFALAWSILTAVGLLTNGTQYCFFVFKARQNAQALKLAIEEAHDARKKEEQQLIPLRHIQPAPFFAVWQRVDGVIETPGSTMSGGLASSTEAPDSMMSGALGSESPELASSTTDVEGVDNPMRADGEPRRWQTYESLGEDQESPWRGFGRSDTESNIGIGPRPVTV